MYIPHPPWANTLDRGLRAVGYVALSVFSIREAGLRPYTPDAAIWYNLAVHMVLATTAGGCALACLTGRSQAEMVILPLTLGSACASWILVVSAHGLGARSTLLLSVIFLLSARMNWLRWLRHRAIILTALRDRGGAGTDIDRG